MPASKKQKKKHIKEAEKGPREQAAYPSAGPCTERRLDGWTQRETRLWLTWSCLEPLPVSAACQPHGVAHVSSAVSLGINEAGLQIAACPRQTVTANTAGTWTQSPAPLFHKTRLRVINEGSVCLWRNAVALEK